eukprot:11184703-Lingulodinium_polyedra.AAC.1
MLRWWIRVERASVHQVAFRREKRRRRPQGWSSGGRSLERPRAPRKPVSGLVCLVVSVVGAGSPRVGGAAVMQFAG